MTFKSGFITIIGRPNVGKSTLLNRLIGEKISIVSDKAQTTRNKIQIIYTDDRMQCVFVDVPGIQQPKNLFGEYMLTTSTEFWDEMDLILYMIDESQEIGRLEEFILEKVEHVQVPIILVINKIDLINEEEIAKIIALYEKRHDFEAIIPISTHRGDGVDILLDEIYNLLPEGPMYYPDDMITDQTERFIVSEIIREKLLLNLKEEVPHGIFVEVESMKPDEKLPVMVIDATIYCEKESHKGIVIGKGGSMLKKIGQSAREEINEFLGEKVHLNLWVKVAKDWREKKNQIDRFGYR